MNLSNLWESVTHTQAYDVQEAEEPHPQALTDSNLTFLGFQEEAKNTWMGQIYSFEKLWNYLFM